MSEVADPRAGANARRAEEAWGGAPPDWIVVLASECDRAGSQRAVGTRIGYSPGVINAVIGNAYRGNLGMVEAKVRGRFMNATVDCPILGEISTADCLDHQRRPLMATNPQRVALWRACRVCPNRRT